MSLLAFCQWLQGTWPSTLLRESTWGFPILGAIHVLGIAWFGAAILIVDLRLHGREQFLPWKRIGLAVMLVSGALLFWLEPMKCYNSVAFRIKMSLLLLVLLNSRNPRTRLAACLSLVLWAGMILAAQGISFF